MKKVYQILSILLFVPILLMGQEGIIGVEVSKDTVLMGNYFKVEFTIENVRVRDFSPPNLDDFYIVGGPNQSSSFSMTNGEISQSKSYTYHLQPKEEGAFVIKSATVETKEGALTTDPVSIVVISNPDGLIEQPKQRERRLGVPKDSAPSKKKRKTYKL